MASTQTTQTNDMDSIPLTGVVTVTGNNNGSSNPSTKLLNSEKDATDQPLTIDNLDPTAMVTDAPEGFNVYRNKKTLTQGLMDIALFSANANQLRYIIDVGANTSSAFYYISVTLIITSLILQIGVGLILLMSIRYNVTVECQREMAYRYGNYAVAGIFLVTVVNVFIAAFGGPTSGTVPFTPSPT